MTGYSCDCLGFQRVQRCMHHSALFVHLGWLPEAEPVDPAPAPVEVAPIHGHHHPEPANDDLAPALFALVLVDGVPEMLVIGDGARLSVNWLVNEGFSDDLAKVSTSDSGDIPAVDIWLAALIWQVEGHAAMAAPGPAEPLADAA